MNHDQIADIIATEVNLTTLDVWRTVGDQTDLDQIRGFDDCLRDLGKNIIRELKHAFAHPPPDQFGEWLVRMAPPAPDARKSAAIEPEVPAVDEPTVARTTSGLAEPSPNDGDGAEAGAAIHQPKADREPPTTPNSQAARMMRRAANDRGEFRLQLIEWMASNKLSNCEAARRAGVSDPTIYNILEEISVNPAPLTKKKILAAIDKDSAKKSLHEDDPAQFITKHLKKWLSSHDLDARSATTVLSVNKNALQDILEGHLPVSNVLVQLSKHIPGIKARYPWLIRAIGKQERSVSNG